MFRLSVFTFLFFIIICEIECDEGNATGPPHQTTEFLCGNNVTCPESTVLCVYTEKITDDKRQIAKCTTCMDRIGYILLERDYLDPNPTNLSNFTDITLIKILNMNVTRSKQEEYRTGLVALTRNALKNNPMEHLEHQQPTTQVTNTPGAGSSVSVMSPSSLGAPVVINIPVGQAPPPTSFLPPPPFFPFPPPWNDMSPPQQMPQPSNFCNTPDCFKQPPPGTQNIDPNTPPNMQPNQLTYLYSQVDCLFKIAKNIQNGLKEASAGARSAYVDPLQRSPFPVMTPVLPFF